jgi:hypothetical protein
MLRNQSSAFTVWKNFYRKQSTALGSVHSSLAEEMELKVLKMLREGEMEMYSKEMTVNFPFHS